MHFDSLLGWCHSSFRRFTNTFIYKPFVGVLALNCIQNPSWLFQVLASKISTMILCVQHILTIPARTQKLTLCCMESFPLEKQCLATGPLYIRLHHHTNKNEYFFYILTSFRTLTWLMGTAVFRSWIWLVRRFTFLITPRIWQYVI